MFVVHIEIEGMENTIPALPYMCRSCLFLLEYNASKCVKQCLRNLPVRDGPVVISEVALGGEDDGWSVRLSYACRGTGRTLMASPQDFCHCGSWSDGQALVCRGKNANLRP